MGVDFTLLNVPPAFVYSCAHQEPPVRRRTARRLALGSAYAAVLSAMALAVRTYQQLQAASPGPSLRVAARALSNAGPFAEALQATISANPSQITIHDVGTLPIGEEWAVDGGWWEMAPTVVGAPDRTGFYLNLMRKQGDGSWRIHRGVINSFPVAGM